MVDDVDLGHLLYVLRIPLRIQSEAGDPNGYRPMLLARSLFLILLLTNHRSYYAVVAVVFVLDSERWVI